jgi:hypothetical protein
MSTEWVHKAVKEAVIYWHVFCSEENIDKAGRVVDRQYGRLESSGLISVCSEVRIIYIGTIPFPRPSILANPKVRIVHHAEKGYEGATTTIIHKACVSGEHQGPILYLHTKGVTHDSGSPSWAWSEMMEFFVIDRWEQAIRMLATKRAVGCDFFRHYDVRAMRDASGRRFLGRHKNGRWHFSGNMWWAQPSHIASLPPPSLLDRFACCEDWIASNVGPNVSHMQFGVLHTTSKVPYTRGPCDLYRHAYTREYYEHGGLVPGLEWTCSCCPATGLHGTP